MFKNWIYISCLHFKTQFKSWKPNHSFNDSKRRRRVLSSRKAIICIIKRNNVKTSWWLLFEFCSFVWNKKTLENKDSCVVLNPSKGRRNLTLSNIKNLMRYHLSWDTICLMRYHLLLKKTFVCKYYKIKNHCHYSGKCRGVAHTTCNSKYSILKVIPNIFHNGSNHDSHFITKELEKKAWSWIWFRRRRY